MATNLPAYNGLLFGPKICSMMIVENISIPKISHYITSGELFLLPFKTIIYSVLADCPYGRLERHTEVNHGDMCRNDVSINGIGWSCPVICFQTVSSVPYCWKSPSDASPCRIGKLVLANTITIDLILVYLTVSK